MAISFTRRFPTKCGPRVRGDGPRAVAHVPGFDQALKADAGISGDAYSAGRCCVSGERTLVERKALAARLDRFCALRNQDTWGKVNRNDRALHTLAAPQCVAGREFGGP